MIKSMTGFGRATLSTELFELKVESKSVNSKYCDINVKLPKAFSLLEIPIRTIVQERLVRGKVDIYVEMKFHQPVQTAKLDPHHFLSYLGVLEQMKTLGGLQDKITLDHLLKFQDIVSYESASIDQDELDKAVLRTVEECLGAVDSMRTAEGANLEKDLLNRLVLIDGMVEDVVKYKDDIYTYWLERFKGRMVEFGATDNTADRIVQEASVYAEKADIQEEITRIRSHQSQFRKILLKEFPCGKKLDFLCQEMYREWNTIASKSIKSDIINTVVEAKSLVDSIREQVQNLI